MKHEKTMTQSHDDILPDKNSLELLCNTFDESEIKCPFWRTGQTMRYLEFGGVDFKCDYCDCSFCEFDKLTEFLASHCHDYEKCIYYRKHKDDKSNFPCDDCGYDINNCCSYPETPDDYCVCGDKKIPVPTQTASEVAETFNYALLSVELGDYLKHKEEQLKNEYMNFTANCGRIFAEAQEKLAKHGFGEDNGLFRKWIASMGFSKSAVYRMIDIHKFRSSQIGTNEGQAVFDALPKTLQADISAPSAPPELVDKVMSGDITTHKDFIALKKQLEAAKEQNAVLSAEKEQFHRASKANLEKLNEERERNSELEQQIRELESRPVDVAVQSDSDAERKFNETIRKINLDFEIFRDEADKELADMRNQRNKALDRAEAAEAKLNAPKGENNIKPFVVKMTYDDLSAIIEALSGSPKLQNIMKKVQVIRV